MTEPPEDIQTQPLTTKQKQAISKLVYYHNRYDNDPEFRQREIDRNRNRIKKSYAENEELRNKMKANALARYYRLKAQKSQ